MYIYICIPKTIGRIRPLRSITFLYVLLAFLLAKYFVARFVKKVSVPIRSAQPSCYSVEALYVPKRSYYVPKHSV